MQSKVHDPLKIGFLGLSLGLYEKAIPETMKVFHAAHERLKQYLGTQGEVVADGFATRRDGIEETVSRIVAAGADVLVIVLHSYSPSLESLRALLYCPLPLLVWNTQTLAEVGPDFTLNDLLENHGMHGVQDLCNCLRRAGRSYALVSGHLEDDRHRQELAGSLRLCGAVSFARRLRVGLLGFPFNGMGDFGVDETRMSAEWGPTTRNLTLGELAAHLENVSDGELNSEVRRDREMFEFSPDITEQDHARSARLSCAVRSLVTAERLDAITMHFGIFGEDPRFETCPFLGFNHLIAEGFGYSGEGNVTTAALDAMLGYIFGVSNFCEMFTASYSTNEVLFYHMGEGNYRMAPAGSRPVLKKVPYTFGAGQPYVVPIHPYRPGPSTFVNVTTDRDGRFMLIAFTAEVMDYTRMLDLNAAHFKARFECRLGDFLTDYSRAAGTHHMCRIEGLHLESIEQLAELLGMKFCAISSAS